MVWYYICIYMCMYIFLLQNLASPMPPKVWPKLPSPQGATVHHDRASWDAEEGRALDSQPLSAEIEMPRIWNELPPQDTRFLTNWVQKA